VLGTTANAKIGQHLKIVNHVLQPNNIKMVQINYNSLLVGSTMNGNQFYLGQISILHPSNGGDPVYYNKYTSYEQSKQHLTEEKSETSEFGVYENTFYLKREKDDEIEMAV